MLRSEAVAEGRRARGRTHHGVGSVNGNSVPVPGMASYALSKSALQGMGRGLARNFGPCGVTINVVQPGRIQRRADERADAQLRGDQAPRPARGGFGHSRPAGRPLGGLGYRCHSHLHGAFGARDRNGKIGLIGAGEVGKGLARPRPGGREYTSACGSDGCALNGGLWGVQAP